MKITDKGSVIVDVRAVEKSLSQHKCIAFQDDDGAVVHITIEALDKLIAFRNTLPKEQKQDKLNTFFAN
jgi:hypothetical protein